MTKIKTYDFEKYSILDIKEYLKNKNYEVNIKYNKSIANLSLEIKNSKVSVDFPQKSKILDCDIAPSIRFEDYPKDENYKIDNNLFNDIKKKFGIKSGVKISNVKDWEKIN